MTEESQLVNSKVTVEKNSRNVLTIHEEVTSTVGWERWYLLSSDRHFDSISNNRELQIEHLEKAKERDARVLDFGDLFDAMQGKYDPRKKYSDMREEYSEALRAKAQGGYFDIIVNDALKFYQPYAKQLLLFGRGNHEASVKKHHDTDLIESLVAKMKLVNPAQEIFTGGYGGWVRFKFTFNGTEYHFKNLKYNHGAGGGGPVTRDVIQSNRMAVWSPDADIVESGHVHESWVLAIPRERLSRDGEIYQDLQWHGRTPTYKNDFTDGGDGFHNENRRGPKPMGCHWLRFYKTHHALKLELTQDLI